MTKKFFETVSGSMSNRADNKHVNEWIIWLLFWLMGISSWIDVTGLFNELSLMVNDLSEGYEIWSYITLISLDPLYTFSAPYLSHSLLSPIGIQYSHSPYKLAFNYHTPTCKHRQISHH